VLSMHRARQVVPSSPVGRVESAGIDPARNHLAMRSRAPVDYIKARAPETSDLAATG